MFDESGYRCRLFPVPRLPTRAPPASVSGQHQPDVVRVAEGSTKPFAVTTRPLGDDGVKLIFWYVGVLEDGEEGFGRVGTYMQAEGFGRSGLFEVDEAIKVLAFEGDRDLLRSAIELVEYHCS